MNVCVEDAIGTIDGVNRIFDATNVYVRTSLSVFLNGLLSRKGDHDGWVELDGTSFEFKEAPHTEDLIRIWYRY